MKLAEVHFDWNPSIPGADSRGENLLFPLKTQSVFRADDGWTIEKLPSGEFRLHREGMPAPVVVGDGYSYVEAEVPDFVTPVEHVDREELLARYPHPGPVVLDETNTAKRRQRKVKP